MKPLVLKRSLAATAVLIACGAAAMAAETAAAAVPGTVQHASVAGMDYVSTLFVFMLATFVGLDVVRRVSRLLHTPLMSLTNAISAISVVGAILLSRRDFSLLPRILAVSAVALAFSNVVGGYLITDRMLKMFKRAPQRRAGQSKPEETR
jgi:NAD(P) transhydrogenase subunit alpha